MARLKACKECGFPFKEGKLGIWQNNGVITDAKDPSRRGIVYETDNLEYVLKGIEDIIGVPVEHLMIESKRKAGREYIESRISPTTRKVLRILWPKLVIKKMIEISRLFGYGDVNITEMKTRYRGGKDRVII